MPYTLPAALTTVMDSGKYEPYLRVVVNSAISDTGASTVQPLSFRKTAIAATVSFAPFSNDVDDYAYFRLVRGALIDGTPSTISTVWYITKDMTYNGKFVTLTGHILSDDRYMDTAANVLFNIIENIVGPFAYEGTTPAWLDLDYNITGEAAILDKSTDLINELKQKYLLFITENGWSDEDNGAFGNRNYFFVFIAPLSRALDYTITDILFNGNEHREERRLIFTDEFGVIHAQGADTLPIHNLGGHASTTAFPAPNTVNRNVGARSSHLPVHLKRRTGDKATCAGDGTGLNDFNSRINVIEVLDLEATPAWYQIIEGLVWHSGNEGNIQPGLDLGWKGTAGTAVYTSSNTTAQSGSGPPKFAGLAPGKFIGNLSLNDTNLQAAMQTLDRHIHGVQAYLSNAIGGTVPAGLTYYCYPYEFAMPSATSRIMPILRAGTVKNLYVRQTGTQPASGNLIISVTTPEGAIDIVIAAGTSGAQTHSNTTVTEHVDAGTFITFKLVNNAAAPSTTLGFIGVEVEFDP